MGCVGTRVVSGASAERLEMRASTSPRSPPARCSSSTLLFAAAAADRSASTRAAGPRASRCCARRVRPDPTRPRWSVTLCRRPGPGAAIRRAVAGARARRASGPDRRRDRQMSLRRRRGRAHRVVSATDDFVAGADADAASTPTGSRGPRARWRRGADMVVRRVARRSPSAGGDFGRRLTVDLLPERCRRRHVYADVDDRPVPR